jgi:tetratricopeptide (TPR) repeat protein
MRRQMFIIGLALAAMAVSPAYAAGQAPKAVQDGDAAPAFDSHGNIHVRQDNCRHAIADFSKAIARDSGSPYLYLNRGLCYRKLGQIQRALVDFDAAVAAAQARKAAGVKRYITQDALFTLLTQRGRILLDIGRATDAQQSFKAALILRPKDEKVKAQMAKATAIVAATQTNARLFHSCSNADPAKSIADCTKLIESPNVAPNMQLAAYQKRGVAYNRNNEQKKALADFNTVLKRQPQSAPTRLMRGVAYAQLHQWDRAVDDFSAAIRIDQSFAQAYVLRGRAYEQKGALKKAAADYTRAIALAPESVEARVRLKALKSKLDAGTDATDASHTGDH